MSVNRASQRGVSLSGLLVWGVIIGLLAVLGMKVSPHVMEFYKVKQAMSALAKDTALKGADVAAVRAAFDRRTDTAYIETIKGSDLDITKKGNDLVLAIAYSRQIPLFGPVSLVIDFEASTDR